MKPSVSIAAEDCTGIEVLANRKINSKQFALGNNQYRVVQDIRLMHYPDAKGDLQDIDLTLIDQGGHWEVSTAPYTLKVQQKGLSIDFQDGSNHASCSLANAPDPVMDVNGNVTWIGDGFIVSLVLMGHGVSLQTMVTKNIVLNWTRDKGFSSEIARDAKGRVCEVVNGQLTGNVATIRNQATRVKNWIADLQFPVTFQ